LEAGGIQFFDEDGDSGVLRSGVELPAVKKKR